MAHSGRTSGSAPSEEPTLRMSPGEGDLTTQTQRARKSYMENPSIRSRTTEPEVIERERVVVKKKGMGLVAKILIGAGLSAAALAAIFHVYGDMLLQYLPNYSGQAEGVYREGAPATRGSLALPGQGQHDPNIAAGAEPGPMAGPPPMGTGGSSTPGSGSPLPPGTLLSPGATTAPPPRVVPRPMPPPRTGDFGDRPF